MYDKRVYNQCKTISKLEINKTCGMPHLLAGTDGVLEVTSVTPRPPGEGRPLEEISTYTSKVTFQGVVRLNICLNRKN